MTAKVHRRISRRELIAAVHHAGMPLLIDGNYAYFLGIDTRGREFEIILAADEEDDELWVAVHALQTRFRRNI